MVQNLVEFDLGVLPIDRNCVKLFILNMTENWSNRFIHPLPHFNNESNIFNIK